MFPNGVSNQFISFPAFWSLSPYSWTSMYGGRMQFNVMDTTIPNNIAYMAQNCLNPFFWAMYNRQYATTPSIMEGGGVGGSTLSQEDLNAAYQNGYNTMKQQLELGFIQSDFTIIGNNIATVKADIDALIANDQVPAETKKQLENLKKELEKMTQELQKLSQNNDKLAPDKIREQLEAYRGQLAGIQDAIKTVKDGVAPAPTSATEPTSPTSATEPTDVTEPTKPTEATKPTAPTKPTKATKPTTPSQPTQATVQAREITKDIYVATEGIGTDNEKLERAINKINKDNVVEVFKVWEQNDYNSKTGDGSLLETIYDDVFSGDTRKKYTKKILAAFKDRARAKGVDISAEEAVIEAELNATFWCHDNKVYQAMNDIYAKMKNK